MGALLVVALAATPAWATAPNQPAAPSAVGGNGQIVVTYTAPTDNGTPISSYKASCASTDGGTTGSFITPDGSVSPITVTGLTNGSNYTCDITATDADGVGPTSPESNSVLVATVPGQPGTPTVTSGNQQIGVTSDTPASNGGSPITKYTATCSSSNGGATGTTTLNGATDATINVGLLTNGKNYTCTVTATNGVGDSTVSGPSALVVPAAVPSQPTQPSVTNGSAQLVVTSNSPANNGSTIISYTATCTSSNGGILGTGTLTSATDAPINVSPVSNGATYTCAVLATNGAGPSPASPNSAAIVVGVPDAPAQPTLAATNGQIVVTYVQPAGNGSQIASYFATCTSSNGGATGAASFVTGTGSASPITVTGLTNGKTYTCTVTATNGVGTSAASPASAPAVPAAGVPTAPAQPTVVPGNAQITVTFVTPVDNGSPIISYTATCTSSNGGTLGTATLTSATAAPITVIGLTNTDTYTCTVAALNGVGPSAASPVSLATIPVPGAPSSPAQPTVARGTAQLVVTYAQPADNGSPITSYTATCTSSDSGATGTGSFVTSNELPSPITVASLTNGKTYTCNVFATNAVAAGAPSPDSAPIVVGVPNQPSQPLIAAGNGQITVTYVAPASNGGVITSFTATCTSSNGGAIGTGAFVTPDGSASPITVTGLTNGDTYTCTVVATNASGSGPASPASGTAVPTAGAPATPAQPTVARGNGQLTVTSSTPVNSGSVITGYVANCVSSDGGAAGSGALASATDAPILVTPLTNGKTYTCTVTATNAVGASPASPASAAIVVGIPEQPAQPAVVAGNSLVVVTFAAPANAGSPIVSFTATCTSSDGGVTGSITLNSATATPISVTPLTNAKTYTCTVIATNAAGNSAASPNSVAVVPAAVPDPPAQPTVTLGNERITVAFVAPNNNGTAITTFAATCVSSDGGSPGAKNIAGPVAAPIIVTNLSNGHTYTCTVTATNTAGLSPPSTASIAVVPAAAPSPPTLSSIAAGSASITVSFSGGNNNGSTVGSFTATCASTNGGITAAVAGPTTPIVVGPLTNGNIYSCSVTATNAIGVSVASAVSRQVVVGEPGAPSILPVVSGPAPAASGSLKVSFHAGAPNAGAIMVYRATCVPVASGSTRSNTGTGSPVIVSNLLSGHAYSCAVTETNFFGTSLPSGSMVATVGTPAPPKVLQILHLGHGVALSFSPPAANGHPITDYRARCTSTDGGVPNSPLQFKSPIVVNKLTLGKTYVCQLTAINVRGASPATTIGPVVIVAPTAANLAACTGHSGSVVVSPGLLLSVPKPHTLTLGATLGSCSGPYVSSAQISVTFRTKSAISCNNAIGVPSGGSGTVSWTSPTGLGTSGASIQFVIDTTQGHVTLAHFSGVITTRSNVFSDAHVTGTLVLKRGLDASVAGGDCSAVTRLGSFSVATANMTIS